MAMTIRYSRPMVFWSKVKADHYIVITQSFIIIIIIIILTLKFTVR